MVRTERDGQQQQWQPQKCRVDNCLQGLDSRSNQFSSFKVTPTGLLFVWAQVSLLLTLQQATNGPGSWLLLNSTSPFESDYLMHWCFLYNTLGV